jgi:hypothetical protein
MTSRSSGCCRTKKCKRLASSSRNKRRARALTRALQLLRRRQWHSWG